MLAFTRQMEIRNWILPAKAIAAKFRLMICKLPKKAPVTIYQRSILKITDKKDPRPLMYEVKIPIVAILEILVETEILNTLRRLLCLGTTWLSIFKDGLLTRELTTKGKSMSDSFLDSRQVLWKTTWNLVSGRTIQIFWYFMSNKKAICIAESVVSLAN